MELVRKALESYDLSNTTIDFIMSSRTSEQWQVIYDKCKEYADENQIDVQKVVFVTASTIATPFA